MRILLVTDAWEPQVNGVVRTLKTTARELTAMGHEVRFLTPLEFRTLPCPTYPEIRLSLFPQGGVNRTHSRVRSRRAAHRHRRAARHGGASLRAAQRFPVHHRLSHALPRVRARALPAAAVVELRLAAALPWAVEGRDGAHAGGGRRSRRQRFQQREALVARRGCRHLPSAAEQAARQRAADLPVRRPRRRGEERRGLSRARPARIEVGGGHGPGARAHPRAISRR